MRRKYRTLVINGKQIIKIITVILIIAMGSGLFLNAPSRNGALDFLIGFNFADKSSIISHQIPLIKTVNLSSVAALAISGHGGDVSKTVFNVDKADEGAADQETEEGAEVKPIEEIKIEPQRQSDANSASGIYINDNTKLTYDVQALLDSKLKFNFGTAGPKVLILHTHATEAYTGEGKTTYNLNESDRSTDANVNIIRVGEEIQKVFKEAGIESVHDKTLHDYPSYNKSYANSLETIERYKAKYPSIKIVLDVHRDAIITQDKKKLKVCADIEGEKAAQVMFVVGTNENGLEHPNWKDNLALALKFQNRIVSAYPELARPINVRKERFNQHATPGSLIIEVGSNGNTLDEAIRGARYSAKAMAELIKNIK